MHTIYFYRVNERYGEFSNFAPFPVLLEDKTWPTSEHYFQAKKFLDATYQERIRATISPMHAARLGRDREQKLRQDWEMVKDDIMYCAVKAKFEQYPELTSLLLATADALIVEHTKNDNYWADGGDGSGKNMLGQTLMKVRSYLCNYQSTN